MYQELSTKVDKVSYNIVVNMMMALFSTCNDKSAWDPKNTEKYQNCTKQISASRRHIQKNFKNVEFFSMNYHGTIHTEVEKILEEIDLNPKAGKGLERMLSYLRNASSPANNSLPCSEIEGCLEGTREVVIRLKMIGKSNF